MVELREVFETYEMVSHENLDVRTITMGISLLDCIDPDLDALCKKIHDKIVRLAGRLVEVGDQLGVEYGVPVINKRVSVTPIALVGGAACRSRRPWTPSGRRSGSTSSEDTPRSSRRA